MALLACETQKNTTDFKAERISRTASFVVQAPIETVFPLFGPVQEMAWAEGWNPHLVYSESKDVEARMIFETPGRFEGEEKYTWIITQYFPQEYLIEYTVSTAERIWFITVQCETQGLQTHTTVSYTYTGLTLRGHELNQEALTTMYADNLRDWKKAINSYLKQINN